MKFRFFAVVLVLAGLGIGYFDFTSQQEGGRFPIKLGLDLAGGTHLVYQAETSTLPPADVSEAMEALRDTIERRVNLFGVSEPLVQVEKGSAIAGNAEDNRLIVELPGVTDVNEAIALIDKTPLLEFKTENPENLPATTPDSVEEIDLDTLFIPTELTGRFLKRATLEFDHLTGEPVVNLEFNSDGQDLFANITTENVGKVVAIYLDGVPISTPVVNEPILHGQAVISGGFTPEEARELVRNLNLGALPVPITLLSSQTVGASLGAVAFDAGVRAGLIGLIIVALFLVFWYRLPGLLAVVSLTFYVSLMIALFKLIPVTLTSAGIAGFILSIGMAVDANILIFERMKEELRSGKAVKDAIQEGFARAWFSIRDGNISSIITAIILFWFGTSIVEGFALTFGLGVAISMFSAITFTRTLLKAVAFEGKIARFLFGAGIK